MKILVIAHAHPDFSLGGGEIAAYTLFKEYKKSKEVTDAFYLGRIDKGQGATGKITKRRQNDYLWEQSTTNLTQMTPVNQQCLANEFITFIESIAPDIVHLHHYLNLGLEIIPIIKRKNPKTKILITLHEFVAICENNGQMIKTDGKQLCKRSTPDDCAKCYPDKTPNIFWLRRQNYYNHFKYVDHFIAPSNFLLDRYVDWGICKEKITFIENGHTIHNASPRIIRKNEKRNRIGFFGQINIYKGLDVVLSALLEAKKPPDVILEINGANLESQPEDFQVRVRSALDKLTATGIVQFNGPYFPSDISSRMSTIDWVIVPSVWWENSPMVIQEAFSFGKPVICSNIGGMKEKVNHGINGLHVMSGNKNAWLDTLEIVATQPDLWQSLHKQITPPPSHSKIAHKHIELINSI